MHKWFIMITFRLHRKTKLFQACILMINYLVKCCGNLLNLNKIIHSPEYVAELTAVTARFGLEYICVQALRKQHQLHLDIVKFHRQVELWMGTSPYS